jgi:hypothetical protein
MDPTAILVDNLTEALRQVTTYLTLGLATAISALVLDRRSAHDNTSPPVALAGVSINMTPETAKMLLLGLCWVAGAMASYAIEGAQTIVERLRPMPDILAAACTFPSVATAPVGVGIAGAIMPFLFVLPIMWRMRARLRQTDPSENAIVVLLVFIVPYGALILGLFKLDCRA